VGKRTRIAVRFSVVTPERGGADTARLERMSKDFRVPCDGFSAYFGLKDKLFCISLGLKMISKYIFNTT
jgi:hypothetical protein